MNRAGTSFTRLCFFGGGAGFAGGAVVAVEGGLLSRDSLLCDCAACWTPPAVWVLVVVLLSPSLRRFLFLFLFLCFFFPFDSLPPEGREEATLLAAAVGGIELACAGTRGAVVQQYMYDRQQQWVCTALL